MSVCVLCMYNSDLRLCVCVCVRHCIRYLIGCLDANDRHHRLHVIMLLAQVLLAATLVLHRELVHHWTACRRLVAAACRPAAAHLDAVRALGMVRNVSVLLQKGQRTKQKLREVLAQTKPPCGNENFIIIFSANSVRLIILSTQHNLMA